MSSGYGYRTLGKVIREIRDEAGLNKKEFAKLLDVSNVFIGLVEANDRGINDELRDKIVERFAHTPEKAEQMRLALDTGRAVLKFPGAAKAFTSSQGEVPPSDFCRQIKRAMFEKGLFKGTS